LVSASADKKTSLHKKDKKRSQLAAIRIHTYSHEAKLVEEPLPG
jgi:ribosomal protein L32